MRVTAIISAALLLLSDITTAKQLYHRPRGSGWRRDLDDGMRKAAYDMVEGRLERRQSNSASITPSSTADMNETISSACVDGLSSISSVSNQAGVTACYNILSHNIEQGTFQADLRLYHSGESTGAFADMEAANMMVGLNYPASTSFESLVKRSLKRRQTSSNMSEMQQYTLNGFMLKTMDLTKLNLTEYMSLMVPMITLNGVSSDNKAVSTNISSTDMSYFVAGDFQGEFNKAVVTPGLQKVAITASTIFVLPGTTLGIFPTGLIVTSAWMVLFFIAFGAGTLGRLNHRKVFRARKAAVGGRVGTRI